jgi:Icc-related predicted phosphoesterase
VPETTDILLTHGPPEGTRDYGWGDGLLTSRLAELEQLSLHVFGHMHGQFGTGSGPLGVCCVNAASHGAIVIEIDTRMRGPGGKFPTKILETVRRGK